MSTIHIGSDHAGFYLKEVICKELLKLDFNVINHGTNSHESCDYPPIAHDLCRAIGNSGDLGILICGTGIGMSITANRHENIRAALCTTELHARLSRKHNDANVLCLGSRMTGEELAFAITIAFLETRFDGGRHQRRIGQINIANITGIQD